MGEGRHETRFEGVKKTDLFRARPRTFYIEEKVGHPLHDPTSPKKAPAWLVRSMREHGQLQPIVCVEEDGKIKVDVGRSRVRAALLLDEEREAAGEPPFMLAYILRDRKKVTDKQLDGAKDAENIDRRHLTPLAIAEYVARDAARDFPPEYTATRLAAAGVTVDDLPIYAAINACAPKVRDAIRDGVIPWRVAPDFASLPRDEQVAKFEEIVNSIMIADGRPTKPVTARKVKAALKGSKPAKAKRADKPTPRAVAAFRERLDGQTARVVDLLYYLDGNPAQLVANSPKLAARLDEIRAEAGKPGRKAKEA